MNFFVRPPVVFRTFSNFHRTFVVEQPIICEHVNRIFNHHIKRNCFIPRELCCEHHDCTVENVGCCPNMPCQGQQPMFGEQQMPGMFDNCQQFGDQQFPGMQGTQANAQQFDFTQGPFRRNN